MFVSARFFALLLLVPACVHADGFLDMLSDGGSSHDAEITAQTLTAFFAEVNPAKAQGVAKLMRVYVAAGHTDELLKKLTAKYGEEPVQRLILGPIAKSSSSAGGSASTPAESPSPAPAGDGDAATPATEAVPAGEGGGAPASAADALSAPETAATPLLPLEPKPQGGDASSAAPASSATAKEPAATKPAATKPAATKAAAGAVLTADDGALTLLIERLVVAVETIAKAMPGVSRSGVDLDGAQESPGARFPASLRGAKPGAGALRSTNPMGGGVRLPDLTAGAKPSLQGLGGRAMALAPLAPLNRRNNGEQALGGNTGGNGRRAPRRDANSARGGSPYTSFADRGRVDDLDEGGPPSSSVGGSAGFPSVAEHGDAPLLAYSAAQLAQLTKALAAQPAEMTDSLNALIAPLATFEAPAAEGEGERLGDA
jgi:hypothetical protein